ncbi:MAG TPA: cellulase family glycosylhydrolase, partial [Fusibacter sp.]|nr:cellulase family glycosylhydrolase [Fusibacter sp.]
MAFIYAKGTQLYSGESPILLRGFGLGGWFLPEGYMWKLYTKCDRPRRMEALIETLCGEEYAAKFWEDYFDSYITERDIEQIAARGYNSVRLPINARKLYHMTDDGLTFDVATIQRIDRLIDWCRKWNIYVILDMHGAPGGQTGANIDDSLSDLPELFMNDQNVEILTQLWLMLAMRYKDEPIIA